jgi:recombinational DNA repair protein RecR
MDSSAMAGADPNYKESETPESDILAMQDMKDIKGLYNILKTYNKNIFPIKSFNINGVDIGTFMRTLKNREKIIQTLNSLPSIAIRI